MRTAPIPGRPGGVPTGLEASIRQVVQRQSSQNVIYNFRTMTQVVGSTLAARRFSMILLDAFALAALVLAAIVFTGDVLWSFPTHARKLACGLALGAPAVQCAQPGGHPGIEAGGRLACSLGWSGPSV